MSSSLNSKNEYFFLRCNFSLSGFYSEKLLNSMKELTVAMSIKWKNMVFHHLAHFLRRLYLANIWTYLSTPFIKLL